MTKLQKRLLYLILLVTAWMAALLLGYGMTYHIWWMFALGALEVTGIVVAILWLL